MTDKEQKYQEMVAARKACSACKGLINPSQPAGGKYDSQEIGVLSSWQGGLNALAMVVLQDWGDVASFERQRGIDNDSPTNKVLCKLLSEVGLLVELPSGRTYRGDLFFTNAILCLKTGKVDDRLLPEWVANCMVRFLRPQIELIQPKLVICVGEWAFKAVLGAYGIRAGQFREAVEQESPLELPGGTRVLAVYHCSPSGINRNRPLEAQRRDWQRILSLVQKFRKNNSAV